MGMFDFLRGKPKEISSTGAQTSVGEPYRQWGPPIEEPPIEEAPIEGKFTEIPDGSDSTIESLREKLRGSYEGTQESPIPGRVPSPASGTEQEEARAKVLKAQLEKAKAEAELRGVYSEEERAQKKFEAEEASRQLSLRERKYEQGKARRQEVGKMASTALRRGVTLGGVPAVEGKGGIRGMYFGRAKGSMYVPPTPSVEKAIPTSMQPLNTLRLGGLKGLTSPGAMAGSPLMRATLPSARLTQGFKMKQVSGVALERLRNIVTPRGLSPIEKFAYTEIKQNGDIDTPSHVIEELGKLGVSQGDASRAIQSLVSKQLVKKDRMFQGEPVLEVTR